MATVVVRDTLLGWRCYSKRGLCVGGLNSDPRPAAHQCVTANTSLTISYGRFLACEVGEQRQCFAPRAVRDPVATWNSACLAASGHPVSETLSYDRLTDVALQSSCLCLVLTNNRHSFHLFFLSTSIIVKRFYFLFFVHLNSWMNGSIYTHFSWF